MDSGVLPATGLPSEITVSVSDGGIENGAGSLHDWLVFVAGVIVVLATAADLARSLIMTRGSRSFVTGPVNRIVRTVIMGSAQVSRSYLRRDSIQSWVAPMMIISSLMTWLGLFLIGYTLILEGLAGLSLQTAFRESGSSLFTLGYASADRSQLSVIDFMAAATGPITIGLMISYLPALYGAYNRRELDVALLKARAGEPNWGPEILARYAALGTDNKHLEQLWNDWETWAADVSESHTCYPALIYTRSARPMRNWLIALLATMDAAALALVLRPKDRQVGKRIFLRQGIECLRDIAVSVGIRYDPDPTSGTPINLSRDEFVEAVEMMTSLGYEPQRDIDKAWPLFSDWRMMYEGIVYDLARRIDAVPAKWSGPRRHVSGAIAPHRPQYVLTADDGSVAFPPPGTEPTLPPRRRLG
jgi:hypothetical protein